MIFHICEHKVSKIKIIDPIEECYLRESNCVNELNEYSNYNFGQLELMRWKQKLHSLFSDFNLTFLWKDTRLTVHLSTVSATYVKSKTRFDRVWIFKCRIRIGFKRQLELYDLIWYFFISWLL